MSDASETDLQQAQQQMDAIEETLLEQAINATRQTERSEAELLLKNLTEQALSGVVSWDKNLSVTFDKAIERIDQLISNQVAEIMHNAKFQKLEGSWRGLHHLVSNTETNSQLKIKMLNLSKRELYKDLDKAVEFDQSETFKKIYESEFGTAGGEPYGVMIGDYEFSSHPDDIDLLTNMSNVAAGAFCPFIASAGPEMFGFDSMEELSKPRDIEKIFESQEYIKWRSFRESEDSRFVTMVMPRVLARLPYGEATKPVDEFNFEELPTGSDGRSTAVSHQDYTWMNASYVYGANMTKAFSQYNWCVAIRGAEGGGKVDNLPTHLFAADDGDTDVKCPTEIAITDRREAELSKQGFLPLCHYKNTDFAVFFGGQTAQKPKQYDDPEATSNAEISARLPYIMATARIAHYLKVMARDKIGSFMEVEDCETWLNRWISSYTNGSSTASAEMKAKFPLREAKVKVEEVPGRPGSYNAVAHLRPWLQMEELTASLRMVANIPKK